METAHRDHLIAVVVLDFILLLIYKIIACVITLLSQYTHTHNIFFSRVVFILIAYLTSSCFLTHTLGQFDVDGDNDGATYYALLCFCSVTLIKIKTICTRHFILEPEESDRHSRRTNTHTELNAEVLS